MRFKFVLTIATLILSATVLPSVTHASNGTDHFGPFQVVGPDGSSCGVYWATDTANRYFDVHDNGDGTFRVTESFKDGTFTTNGATSPGACESAPHHGTTVAPGINGQFQGTYEFTVASDTYNPNACQTADCAGTYAFTEAVFGGADPNYPLRFNFEYSSNDKTLQYRHWQDMGSQSTATDYSESFNGDIANS